MNLRRLAKLAGSILRQTSGPVLEKPKDLAALLTNLENQVLPRNAAEMRIMDLPMGLLNP